MANELNNPDGLALTLAFSAANLVANAATKMTLAQGGSGFVVPTGYKFHALALHIESNAAINAGTVTAYVSDNNTALANGPVVALDANTQAASDTERPAVQPIAAAHVVGVKAVADANVAPNTLDFDAIVIGVLRPA